MSEPVRTNKGFTLVELLVVMMISGIIMMGVLAVFGNQTRATALQEDYVTLEQNLRAAMDFIHRDSRIAGAYVKDSMPVFVVGPITYYYKEGGIDKTISLNSNGNPDALMLNYSTDVGLNVTNGTSTSNSLKACNDSNINIVQLVADGKFPVSNGGKVQFVEVTNLIPIGGTCYNIVFNPGQSSVNNSSGVSFDLIGGKFWPNIQSIAYYINANADGNGTSALMRGVNSGIPYVVAYGITDLQVVYVLRDGTATTAPQIPPPIAAQTIERIRLTVAGETRNAHSLTGEAPSKRTRTMTTEVQVRNLAF